jgi:hypothetical protein
MAILIVDPLEMVEIHEHDRHLLVDVSGDVQASHQHLPESLPVQCAGQRIGVGLVGQVARFQLQRLVDGGQQFQARIGGGETGTGVNQAQRQSQQAAADPRAHQPGQQLGVRHPFSAKLDGPHFDRDRLAGRHRSRRDLHGRDVIESGIRFLQRDVMRGHPPVRSAHDVDGNRERGLRRRIEFDGVVPLRIPVAHGGKFRLEVRQVQPDLSAGFAGIPHVEQHRVELTEIHAFPGLPQVELQLAEWPGIAGTQRAPHDEGIPGPHQRCDGIAVLVAVVGDGGAVGLPGRDLEDPGHPDMLPDQ